MDEDALDFGDPLPGRPWYVFSDRGNNQTFTRPGGGSPNAVLDFMEKLWVVEKEGDWLHLVKDEQPNGLSLSNNFSDYGWVQLDKLLLWKRCMVTPNKISRKAMILNTVSAIETAEDIEATILKFESGPDGLGDYTGDETLLFQFFYVYKTTEEWILLGENPDLRVEEKEAKQDIAGWAPKNRVTPWNHRVAVEPNWEPTAKRERCRGTRAIFVTDESQALRFRNNISVRPSTIVWKQDKCNDPNRPPADWRRFPILSFSSIEGDENIFKAGVIGQVITVDRRGQIVDSTGSYQIAEEFLQVMSRQLQKRSNINVVFVVDGTLSMSPYLKSVKDGITNSIEALDRDWSSQSNFKFGGVVYRDYSEGHKERELHPVDVGGTADWFVGKEYHRNDTDSPEALYYGLEGALQGIGLSEEETNVIVVIGDAGNHKQESRVNLNRLEKDLAKYSCHVLAFQVHHEDHPAYDDFITQLKELTDRSTRIVYNATKEFSAGLKYYQQPAWEITRWRNIGDMHKLKYGASGGFIVDIDKGKSLKPRVLADGIVEYVSTLKHNYEFLSEIIYDLEAGKEVDFIAIDESTPSSGEFKEFSSPMAAGVLSFLKSCGIAANRLKHKKFQLYMEAYSSYYVEGQQSPLFKKVLFFSYRELNHLLQTLSALDGAWTATRERKAMQKVAYEILRDMSGDQTENLQQLTIQDLNAMIWGLPPNVSRLLNEVRIEDITDRNAFPDEQFIIWRDKLCEAYERLEAMFFDEDAVFENYFLSRGNRFFWIDADMIP